VTDMMSIVDDIELLLMLIPILLYSVFIIYKLIAYKPKQSVYKNSPKSLCDLECLFKVIQCNLRSRKETTKKFSTRCVWI